LRKIIPIGLIIFGIAAHSYSFDHDYKNYDAVLKKYVQNGLVIYSSLKSERAELDAFIDELKGVSSAELNSWSRDQQLAFWINAYNGWFLQIVTDHYPIKKQVLKGLVYPANSVQQIRGVWTDIKSTFAGREVSLDFLEHQIIRLEFGEPRIHFAIVCASIGCPLLRSEAFRPSNLDAQLESAARDFVNNPTKVKFEPQVIRISKIFDWFSSDFSKFGSVEFKKTYSKKEAGPIGFISRYVSPADGQILSGGVKVAYFEYDWSLNEQK
jgi:hypothetical protein